MKQSFFTLQQPLASMHRRQLSSGVRAWSWRVAAGQNSAFDKFPNQLQIFYRARGKGMWYDPVFQVHYIAQYTLPSQSLQCGAFVTGKTLCQWRLEVAMATVDRCVNWTERRCGGGGTTKCGVMLCRAPSNFLCSTTAW